MSFLKKKKIVLVAHVGYVKVVFFKKFKVNMKFLSLSNQVFCKLWNLCTCCRLWLE